MSGYLECASVTNMGNRRINEDSIGVYKNGRFSCYILCDGLGGHGMGDVASSLAVEVFGSQFAKTPILQALLVRVF